MQADTLNQWARAKYRREWHEYVYALTSGDIPPKPLERAWVRLTRRSSSSLAQMDADNLRYSFKAVLDGFVKAGILLDDNMSVIGEPEVRWEKAAPKKGSISVEIAEITS